MPSALLQWSLLQFQAFILILMRVAPILFLMPLLSARNVPGIVKAGLALSVSLILLPLVRVEDRWFPQEPLSFGYFMAAEMMVGMVLGLAVKLVFAGVQLAGEFAAYQMGLAMAGIFDPQSGGNNTVVAEFTYVLALLIFLQVDGHHWFFRALSQSFALVTPGKLVLQEGLVRHLMVLAGQMFVIAVKIAAPVMAVLFFTQLALGILAKMVPQINILITSFPLTIGLGLLFLGFSVELCGAYLRGLFEESCRGLLFTVLPLMESHHGR